MRETTPARAGTRMARMALMGAGILLLSGCATGYSFVQPGAAGSGGYYTSEPYSGQGYYDYYGTGPYYAGTGGYGYYDGTWPYGGAYDYYGPGYYGYGPQWSFNVGISNVWDFPGYWGPWYSTGFPLRGCHSWSCGGHLYLRGHRGDWRHHHRGHDSGYWRQGDPSSRPPDTASAAPGRESAEYRERAREISAWRHNHYVRSPRWGTPTGRYAGMPTYPAPRIVAPVSHPASFTSFRPMPVAAPAGMPAPAAFSGEPRTAAPANMGRAMAVRPAPAVQPSTRTNTAPGIKIR